MKASERIHKYLTAITFAEAGEWETARDMLPSSPRDTSISWLQRIFAAVTFAEAGLPEVALELIETAKPRSPTTGGFLKEVGLGGVRVTFGVMAAGPA